MKKITRRFGVHEVKSGDHKPALQVATRSYALFSSELSYLQSYLRRRLLPTEPEEAAMSDIVLTMVNIIDGMIENMMLTALKGSKKTKDAKLFKRLTGGYVAFKEKIDWLHVTAGLVDSSAFAMLDELRCLRNHFAHYRPANGRIKLKYRQQQLLTRATLRSLFANVDAIFEKLKAARGNVKKSDSWSFIPPGYTAEMGWK